MDVERGRCSAQPFALPADVAQLWIELSATGLSADAFEADPRRWQFEAGRWACSLLLRSMGAVDFHVARGAALEPIWPAGYIGSITHKHSQVAVAVARDTVCRGIGVDIEKIVPAQRVEEIDEICLHSLERNSTARKCLGASLHASLCFSAKEAIYKALYPAAQRFIDYQEAIVEAVDVQRGTWRAQMLTSVSAGVGRGKVFNGTFRHDLNFVYTALIVS